MRLHRTLLGAAVIAAAGLSLAPAPASAEDGIYVPLFAYRTGPFAGSGIPIVNGMSDYLNMLNERDGGIGGVKIIVEECETSYDTKKGLECYEQVKSKHPVVINPYSTGITLPLIPKAAVDKIPMLSLAYGLSASADGNTFPWIFNPPATYWDGASMFVSYAAQHDGGFDKLKGKKLGLLYLDAPYGKEPIPLLQALAKDYGFELKLYPVPAAEMQSQGSQWLNIRRDRPEWIYIQGFGTMNPTAVKEAAKNSFPMDHLVGNWWAGGDDDARPAGDGRQGLSVAQLRPGRHQLPGDQGHPEVHRRQGQGSDARRTRSARTSTTAASSTRSTSPKRSATRRSSPVKRSSPARICVAVSRRSTSPKRV